MDKIKPLFTATATAIGGRNGHTETSDGIVKADLSLPREMGGPGKPGTATPEHLFAAGYAACFGGSLDFVAKQRKRDATKAKITCAVTIGQREAARLWHRSEAVLRSTMVAGDRNGCAFRAEPCSFGAPEESRGLVRNPRPDAAARQCSPARGASAPTPRGVSDSPVFAAVDTDGPPKPGPSWQSVDL